MTLADLANSDSTAIQPLPEPSDNEEAEFVRRFKIIADKAMIMKKNMLAKNLDRAKAKCPWCPGYWQARIAGPKKHVWIHCDNPDKDSSCNTRFME